MKRILLNLILLCAGELAFSQSAIFNPADPIINYNAGAALGTSTHPSIPAGGQMVKWVRTPKVAGFPSGTPGISWNTSNYKCYMVGSLPFRLRYPNNFVPGATGTKYPIMIFWHGGGETEGQYNQVPGSNPPTYVYQAYGNGVYDNEYQLYQGAQAFETKTATDQNAFILFPQSPIIGFDNTQYSAMNIVIDELIRNCQGDQDRVISMGLSIGGLNSIQYGLLYPQRVSSIISSSPITVNAYANSMQPAIHIPLWIANGGKDTGPDSATIQVFMNGYRASGGVLQQTYFPLQGHVLWDYQWALEPTFDSAWSTAHKANPLVYNDNRYFCPGSPVSATMGITPGFAGYQWDKDKSGVPIPGATSSDYTATSLGLYRARFQRVSNGAWSDWSLAPAKIVAVCPPSVGTGVGLNGNYYSGNITLSGTPVNRVDPSMNFYIENNASPLSGVNGGTYSVRWTGKIQAQFTELYTITTLSDDGIRLWVNGVQLVNNWTDHPGTENSGTIALVAGQKYDIKIEYYNKPNNNNIYNSINNINTGISALKWSSPSTVKQMVPKTQLYPEGTGDPAPPGCVTNTAPANGTTLSTGTTAALTWNSTNATTYDLYLYTTATPPGTATVTGITSNSYNATGLLGSTTYNWFVVPVNSAGSATGCVGNKTSFTTAGSVPTCVINTTPANNSILLTQTTAPLTWPLSPTATSYDVYLWTGSTPPVTPVNVATNSYSASGLLAGTQYSWYIAPKKWQWCGNYLRCSQHHYIYYSIRSNTSTCLYNHQCPD